jgi:hypothetical protein
MSEQERMDHLLREMMAGARVPSLSSAFDQRMKRRLRPRHLDSAGRWLMTAYAILALIISIWAMRSQSIDWSLVVIAILAPLIVAAVVQHRQRTPISGRHKLQGR